MPSEKSFGEKKKWFYLFYTLVEKKTDYSSRTNRLHAFTGEYNFLICSRFGTPNIITCDVVRAICSYVVARASACATWVSSPWTGVRVTHGINTYIYPARRRLPDEWVYIYNIMYYFYCQIASTNFWKPLPEFQRARSSTTIDKYRPYTYIWYNTTAVTRLLYVPSRECSVLWCIKSFFFLLLKTNIYDVPTFIITCIKIAAPNRIHTYIYIYILHRRNACSGKPLRGPKTLHY